MHTITKKPRTSWRDVTINEYYDLKDKLSDDALSAYDKQVIQVAFANNMTEDEVWSTDIATFGQLQENAQWMNKFEINPQVKFTNIQLDEYLYIGDEYEPVNLFTIDTNLQHFTVAQYLDFQTFSPKRKTDERVIGNVLACFIIPKGKKYGEGYDIQELVNIINNNLDIMTAQEVCFFFLKQYLISIRAMSNYFNYQIMIMKWKNKKLATEIEKKWTLLKKHILAGLRLSTMSANLPEIDGMTSSIRTSMSSLISSHT